MINIRLNAFLILIAVFFFSGCGGHSNIVEKSVIADEQSPRSRFLKYERKLTDGDLVGANRFYSKRVLEKKLYNRPSENCRQSEDCLTDASRILGFEIGIGNERSKILSETSVDARRFRILTDSPSANILFIYELVFEDGDWYIDKVYYEDGVIIGGFDNTSES